jgi:hypothetical protein
LNIRRHDAALQRQREYYTHFDSNWFQKKQAKPIDFSDRI